MAAETLVPTLRRRGGSSSSATATGITVFAGGTILMPEIAAGRLKPARALLLHRSGLDGLSTDGGVVRIGAMAPVAALADGPDGPLARFAARRRRPRGPRGRDGRRQPLRAAGGRGSQRGDLGAPLIALGARVRSTGKGGERTEPVEDFLAGDRDGPARARGRVRRAVGRLVGADAAPPARALVRDRERRRLRDRRRAPRRRLRRRPDGRARPRGRAEPQRRGRPAGRRPRRRRRRVAPSTAARCCPSSSAEHSTNWRAA